MKVSVKITFSHTDDGDAPPVIDAKSGVDFHRLDKPVAQLPKPAGSWLFSLLPTILKKGN
jgi:hypothetical protein